MTAQFLFGGEVLTPQGRLRDHGVVIESGRISAVLPVTDAPPYARVALPPETLLVPGYIDVQVNGGGGVQFNDNPSAASARTIAAAHRRLGTLAIMPTLITSPREALRTACAAIQEAVAADAGVLGIHIEGPFLSPHRPGVHRPDLIRPPDADDIDLLTNLARSLAGPVMLTLAPEIMSPATLAALAEAGIILCAGHSEASFEQVAPPLRGITHIFNAMPPLSARAPGVAAAGMLGDFHTGLILDGIHVHPAMARLLLAVRGAGSVMLISDAMSVTGTQADSFMLLGQRILRRNGRLETESGVLAGADLCLAQAVRNAVDLLGLNEATAIAMASTVPAAFLGLSHERGSIALGLRADLLLLGPKLDVLGSWLGGVWQDEAGVRLA
jgi:N-acetylglucosamine-6-phosphate deacetylase